ncbi:MAG: phosphate acetyltransferase, partial [Gammaproteobacteria bacterium]|nr:phosphate acetyltransferase [Gammaproteobacteria bacterium]
MTFLDELRHRAGKRPRRVVFPEGGDPRISEAALAPAAHGHADPLLLGP